MSTVQVRELEDGVKVAVDVMSGAAAVSLPTDWQGHEWEAMLRGLQRLGVELLEDTDGEPMTELGAVNIYAATLRDPIHHVEGIEELSEASRAVLAELLREQVAS